MPRVVLEKGIDDRGSALGEHLRWDTSDEAGLLSA